MKVYAYDFERMRNERGHCFIEYIIQRMTQS